MSLPYNDAEKIAEASEFLRNGGDEERAAAYLQVSIEELPQLLGNPQWKREPVPTPADASFDLWSCDRLNEVL